jgi:hypothetical protein
MGIFLQYLVFTLISILFIWEIIRTIKYKKRNNAINKKFVDVEANQITLQNNMQNLLKSINKQQQNIEKQYDNIKRIEMLVLQKINPLLENNAVVSDLRTKLKDADHTVSSLRSTVLQMAQTIKRMQRREKEEHEQEFVKRRKPKKTQTQ